MILLVLSEQTTESSTNSCFFFFFNYTATTEIYTVYNTLSLHDALPIWQGAWSQGGASLPLALGVAPARSEEHTSELQSLYTISYAVFCLKKKKNQLHNKKSLLIYIQKKKTKYKK